MPVRKRKKPETERRIFLTAAVLVTAALIAGYLLYSCLYRTEPRLNYLDISRNGEPLRVLEGETLRLHPLDRIKVTSLSTTICFNYRIRLESDFMDIKPLFDREVPVRELLPDQEILDVYSFKITAKIHDQEAGNISVLIEPEVKDWLDRYSRSIGHERKLAVLERAAELGFSDEKLVSRRIDEYMALEMWDKAAESLRKVAETRPDEETYLKLLDVYEAMKKGDLVIFVLKKLTEIAPEKRAYSYSLAERLEKAGKINDAISIYEALLKGAPKEELSGLYKDLGFLLADRGQTDRAIDYYKKALDMDQDDVNLYYNLSALYERKGNKDVADKYLAGAVEMQSGDLESRIRLADSLIKRGKYKEAEKYLNEVLKKNPDSMDAWLLTVQMEEKRGNKKGLISAYRKIVSLDSKNGNALYNLGILEYETGDLNNAMIHLENYSKSHPNDTTTGPFLFDIYRKKKKDDLAYKEALKILKARPKEKGYYSFLFEYLDGKKDYKSMVKVMEGGVKNNPGDMDLRRYLIVALLQTGNDRGAVEQIREILNKNPSDVPLLMQLAGLQEKLGNPEEAAEIYKKVLEISPGNEKAEEAYLRMRLEALPGNR